MSGEGQEPMLDGFESLNETAEIPPAPAPAPEVTPPASVPVTPSIDLAKLNESLRPLGNYQVQSTEDVVKIIQDKLEGMHKAHEGRAQLEAELRRLKPMAEEGQRRRYMPPEADPSAGEEIPRTALEPVFQHLAAVEGRLNEREVQEAQRSIRESVESLAARMPSFVTKDIKADLVTSCIATGVYDPEAVFWKQYGTAYVEHERKSALQTAVQKIQEKNAATAGISGPTVVTGQTVVDPLSLSDADQENWLAAEIQKIERDPGYRENVIKDYQAKTGF